MFPYKTSFTLQRRLHQPLYLQLSNQFIQLIKEQKLVRKTKLPGSRTLADLLNVHRKTVVACYEELLLQGWVESIPRKGTFINRNLPELHKYDFLKSTERTIKKTANFLFYTNKKLVLKPTTKQDDFIYINDGTSDCRLTPIEEIARTYRRIASKKEIYKELGYGSRYGNLKLRSVLVDYLKLTRGLKIIDKNVLIPK